MKIYRGYRYNRNRKNRTGARITLQTVLVLGLLGAIFGVWFLQNQKELHRKRAVWDELRVNLEKEVKGFKGKVGLIVKDFNTGWEISINKDMLLPAASIAKLPIMLACFKAAEEGKIRLDEQVALKGAHKVGGSGILKTAPSGTKYYVEDIIALMISQSDNTATNILIDMLGYDYINTYMKHIGLKNSNLSRKMMDFRARARGIENYTTAEDMARALEIIYRRELVNCVAGEKSLCFLKRSKSHDRIPALLPPDTEVAHKTGIERSVCHDVGIVSTQRGDFLICVLTGHKNGNSAPSKKLISTISLTTYDYYVKL